MYKLVNSNFFVKIFTVKKFCNFSTEMDDIALYLLEHYSLKFMYAEYNLQEPFAIIHSVKIPRFCYILFIIL